MANNPFLFIILVIAVIIIIFVSTLLHLQTKNVVCFPFWFPFRKA